MIKPNGGTMRRTAEISPCGRYRYKLGRQWCDGRPPAVFVMLNPSTADHEIDDPTIRRCIDFAWRWNYGGLVVVNLFAVRATEPVDLYNAKDPVGPENHTHVQQVLEDAALHGTRVVCGWGTHGDYMGQDLTVLGWIEREACEAVALGVTRDGHPRHPLYIRATAERIPYRGRR